ncbi:MAG: EAL domain-containing protein [Aquisalinus sp.]|nr:EAL domain-containing protein [Aquisalinus sp.]
MGAQAVRLTSIDIDNALNNNHFEVIFQPIFSLSDGALLRMESFVRWVHPGLGVLPPGAFISFFENQGRMNELTRYVIESSLEQYQQWRGNEGPGFSVNLAFADILDTTFPAWLEAILEENDFPIEKLTLECPTIPGNFPAAETEHLFDALRATGVRLAIEMRGRANEQLRNLKPFPFAEIKTGGSAILRFARTVRGGPGLTAVSELLELAQEHGAVAVAVGVEDQASLEALVSLGFDAAQGNYLASLGKANSFDPATIGEVRRSLALEKVGDEQLAVLAGIEALPHADEPVDDQREEPHTAALTAEQAVEEEAAAAEAAEALEAEKRRKARLAAKRKAAKKAAAQKAAAEQAEIELAEKQRQMEEATAREHAEENARRLQERLTQVYDEEDLAASITPALKNRPSKKVDRNTGSTDKIQDEAPEAGLLLGGSLAQAALGRSAPTPQAPEALAEPADEVETEATDSTDASAELTETEVADDVTADASPDAAPAPDASAEPQEPALTLTEQDKADFTLSVIAKDKAPEADQNPDATTEAIAAEDTAPAEQMTPRDHHFVFSPQKKEQEEILAPISEAELKSEDEVLDEAFRHTEELDPTVHHEDPADGPFNFDSTEKYIAERLLRPKRPKRRNFLQKKYRITHFWPRSWQRKWRALKARRAQERDWDKLTADLD